MIDFSVVIPTYNRAQKLHEAVNSITLQEKRNEKFSIKEIIIVDDCSEDGTKEKVEEYIIPDDIKLVYYRLKNNSGPSCARNIGVKLANSKWIAFQDSDDIWNANKLQIMSSFMEKNPDAEMYSHFYKALLDDNRIVNVEIEKMDSYFNELSIRNIIGAPTMIVKKDIFEELGGFDEKLRALEDWDFALRLSYKYKIMFVPKVLMTVDLISEGVSSNAGNYYDARCRIIAKNRAMLLEKGTFKIAVEKLLKDAEKKGVLTQIGALLENYLKL